MSLLATQDLTIRFGGHVAVNNVTCAFEPGTLTAIVGPNGAGKTTYFNLISGQLRASEGSVHLNGADITNEATPQRTHRGIGRAYALYGMTYANGSVASMGLWNIFSTTTLKKTGPNYYVIGTCP